MEQLRAVIDRVLCEGQDKAVGITDPAKPVFVSDGEGYDIFVIQRNDLDSNEWERLMLPYTDPVFNHPDDDFVWGVWDILSPAEKKKLGAT